MNKENNRGFSGLSELTSDTRTLRQEKSCQSTPQPSAPQMPVFALLDYRQWPTLPAPWSSVDAGETWIWGDFFMTFQKKPKNLLDLLREMQGKKAEYQGMIYHYAMSVFYRIDRNPHGPSHRPIMTLSLEQADFGMLEKMYGKEAGNKILQAEVGDKMGALMIGLFSGEKRLNLGNYHGKTSSQEVKQKFFDILRQYLGVRGQPKMIGNLMQAYGHPETGLPAKNKNSDNDEIVNNAEGFHITGWIWILGILSLVVVIWLASIENQDKVSVPITTESRKFPRAQTSLVPKPVSTPTLSQIYVQPTVAPNGQPWPDKSGYIDGYNRLHGDGLSTLTIDNSQNSSDVFVKLFSLNYDNPTPVRHVYIKGYGKFTLNKLTSGLYDVRYRDLTTGILSKSESFELNETETDEGILYSNMTMTLYKILNGNMQTYSLNELDFQ